MKSLKPIVSGPLGIGTDIPSYIYRIVPHNATTLAAISSDDTLKAFTIAGLKVITEGSHEGVTCLETGPGEAKNDGKVLLTAGRTGTVKLWDGRVKEGAVIVGATGLGQTNTSITSLASSTESHFFATGMEQAYSVAAVSLWDTRKTDVPVIHYAECHNDDVTELKFSINSPTNLLSGSTDGLVNVYDTTVNDEDDALLQVVNHGASIHHAGFISPTAQNVKSNNKDALIYALSHDETLSLYLRADSSSDDEEMADKGEEKEDSTIVFGDLRPRLECEYAVDVLSTGNTLILAAGRHSDQQLDIVPLNPLPSWNFQPSESIRLLGAHGEEIVRTIHIDDQSNTIYTGGEDGLVKVWKAEESLIESISSAEEKSTGAPSKQKKKKINHHKPY